MDIPVVAIPVRCPMCGCVGLSEFPVAVVAIALVKWNNMCLYAPCHEGAWDASERELEAIRHHLGRDWIREHGQAFHLHVDNVTYLDRNEREESRKIAVSRSVGVPRTAVSNMLLRTRQARNLN
jgi:hypothetical protein